MYQPRTLRSSCHQAVKMRGCETLEAKVCARLAAHGQCFAERGRVGCSVDWATLPGNVIDNVLVHIEAKTTPKLRLVCQQWRRHIDQGVRKMVANAKCPQMMPVARIPELFPMIACLDLSCQSWAYGHNLTPASCAQLSSLSKLRLLRSVKLANWSTLPMNGFQAMIGLSTVTELDMTNCRSVGDTYLRCFHSVQSNLKLLVLSGCNKITDRGISHLSTLRHLAELRLASIADITGETLVQLPSSLESLDVSFCEALSDSAIRNFIQSGVFSASLTHLNLTGCQNVKSRTLMSLSSLSHMTRLKMSYLSQLVEIGQWNRLAELCVLDVSYASGLNMQEALPIIGEMTQLRSLRMNGCRRTQGLLPQQLARLKNLRCLELSQWSNIQFGLDVADVLPNLEVLDLSRCYGPINNAQQYLTNASKLKILGLSQISFLPLSVMRGVGSLRSLEVLNLASLGNISNRALQEIARATTLQYLDLSQNGIFCKVTNTGALSLYPLKALKSLKISGWTEVTHNGFLVLKCLSKLTSLNVSSCPKITNKVVRGIADSLPELTELNLVNCFQVTCSGLGALRKMSELDTLKLSLHLKGDIDSQVPNVKDIQLVSPLDAELWEDRSHPSNFQHVLEKYSREEEGQSCNNTPINRL